MKILIHINSNPNEEKLQINVKIFWSYSRNPQIFVVIVDNFIQNMWKYDFLHLYKTEIHNIVDKTVNSYIHHPHWFFQILHLIRGQFSTSFQRDIHKLTTNCGYLYDPVDFISFSVESVWLYFYRDKYGQIYIIFLDFNIFMVYNHHDIFWYLGLILPVLHTAGSIALHDCISWSNLAVCSNVGQRVLVVNPAVFLKRWIEKEVFGIWRWHISQRKDREAKCMVSGPEWAHRAEGKF